MPRINRRLRAQEGSGRLTQPQHEQLLYGDPLGGGHAFENPREEATAWRANRSELLAERHMPGMRPAGYFRFELKCDPAPGWRAQIEELLKRELLDEAEILWAEDTYHCLDPNQPAELCKTFETVEGIRQLKLGADGLKSIAREFDLALLWHTWRGRAELAERYRTRAAAVREASGVTA